MDVDAATLQLIADTAQGGLLKAENWQRVEALDAIVDLLARQGILPGLRCGPVRSPEPLLGHQIAARRFNSR